MSKYLFNRVAKVKNELLYDICDWNLKFQALDPEIKQHMYNAIDELRRFIDNVLPDNIK